LAAVINSWGNIDDKFNDKFFPLNNGNLKMPLPNAKILIVPIGLENAFL